MRGARTFSDDLRARTDDELAALLLARPDLARPPAHDIPTLASRATTPASVQRALDLLDTGGLNALSALIVADGDPAYAARLCAATPAELEAAAHDLWSLALIWRRGDGYRVSNAITQALGPHIGGLAPAEHGSSSSASRKQPRLPNDDHADTPLLDDALFSVAEVKADSAPNRGHAYVAAQLHSAPPDARRLLDLLAWGPPVGDLPPDAPAALTDAVQHLVNRGLLERLTTTLVRLPRHVALALRGDRIAPGDPLRPPTPELAPISERADASALASANELIERIDELGHLMGSEPPRMLKSHALGVRELRRIATALGTDRDDTILLLEFAYAAKLIGVTEPGSRDSGDLFYAPTLAFDAWRFADPAMRWAHLVLAWFGTDRAPGLIGDTPPSAKGESSLGPPAVFGIAAASGALRTVRHTTLDLLARYRQAETPAGVPADDLTALVRWRHPLRDPDLLTDGVEMAVREAAALGVISQQPEITLSAAGAALWHAWRTHPAEHGRLQTDDLAENPDTAAALTALGAALPPSAHELLLQADLTAVVPGRLDGALADLMRSAAVLESRGGAAVFRFTTDSVRRHLDSGETADDLLAALARHSATGVPQPLDYLIRDVARRHGRIRVGSLTTFIVSDDITALDAVEHDTSVTGLGLRRLAPTVLAAVAAKHTVVSALRRAGHAPVAEGVGGGTAAEKHTPTRASERPRLGYTWSPARPHSATLTPDDAARAVAALRSGDAHTRRDQHERSQQSPGPRVTATDPAITLDVLREAAAMRSAVWIGVAAADGGVSRLLFRPTSVAAGRAHGTVEGSDEPRTFSVHRLIGAIPAGR